MRNLHPGMGEAVAERTVLRKKPDGSLETWADVGERVAAGNSALHPTGEADRELGAALISEGIVLMSGRHLQHGDENQPKRAMELFTNCSTGALRHVVFWLLLNGSGVGTCYDDDLMQTDWQYAPTLITSISRKHADYTENYTATETMIPASMIAEFDEIDKETGRTYRFDDKQMIVHVVADSRTGWGKALELYENLTYSKEYADWILILDFSLVRPKGSPIGGMQERPSAGPIPTMDSFIQASQVKATGWDLWKQAMYIDHYFASCVLVGGARRAARIAVKFWKDAGIFEYIIIKQKGDLWSSNNSVAVDDEYYEALADETHPWHSHAKKVRLGMNVASYFGHPEYGTAKGEPGFVNVSKLVANNEGLEAYTDGDFIGSDHYEVSEETKAMLRDMLSRVVVHAYQYIVNPCGEIVLFLLGAYCVIADVVPFHAPDDDVAELAVRYAARALMRVNLMTALYSVEVRRTNRIGVGFTGMFEWAYKRFGYTFRDLIDENRSKPFWLLVSRLARAVDDECVSYAAILGVPVPHTRRTIKPAGTTSKLFGLTEGAHLPSMVFYLRWVQFREDDPIVAKYAAKGYPVRGDLKSYPGMVIVGFPTKLTITEVMPPELIVTAAEATLEEQFQWLRLVEKYWIVGVEEDGETPRPDFGNQISYTAKYDPKVTTFEEFCETVNRNQNTVRACSVMPQEDASGYEYQPEEPVSLERFVEIMDGIDDPDMKQSFDLETLRCQGACPI